MPNRASVQNCIATRSKLRSEPASATSSTYRHWEHRRTLVSQCHRDHYQSEQNLAATGVPHAILQDSFYSELAVQMFNEDGVMKGPGGRGKVSWVGREEIAETAAKLLASDKPLLGTFPMTGPSALDLADTAAVLSSFMHRTLRYEDEPVPAASEWRSKLGVPAWEVDTWVGSYEAIAAGEFERVDPTLATILGRPASDLATYIAGRPNVTKY
jgi:NAD(P)H dehydrogenase (quinone)